MQYGSTDWASWVLPEEEAIKHIKFAYVLLAICRSLEILVETPILC